MYEKKFYNLGPCLCGSVVVDSLFGDLSSFMWVLLWGLVLNAVLPVISRAEEERERELVALL